MPLAISFFGVNKSTSQQVNKTTRIRDFDFSILRFFGVSIIRGFEVSVRMASQWPMANGRSPMPNYSSNFFRVSSSGLSAYWAMNSFGVIPKYERKELLKYAAVENPTV